MVVESGNMSKKKQGVKYQSMVQLVLVIALIVLGNALANRFFFRIDMTKENRYSLSQTSKDLAAKLDDVAFFRIYLDGESLPPKYVRLKNAFKEMLDEFRIYSNNMIEYEFVAPFEGKTLKEAKNIAEQLASQGIFPRVTSETEGDANSNVRLVPGAMVTYGGKEIPLNILQRNFGTTEDELINQSIEEIEFLISKTLRQCLVKNAQTIAFLDGHGELPNENLADIYSELSDYYSVERFNINVNDSNCFNQFRADNLFIQRLRENQDSMEAILTNKLSNKLNHYDAVVIAKPKIPFNRLEAYLLDQYVMQGGKLILMADAMKADMDSFRVKGKTSFIAIDQDFGDVFTRMLFNWGVRLNYDLIQDARCAPLVLMMDDGYGRATPQTFDWVYSPTIPPLTKHPIVKNIEPVWLRFAGSIDTVGKSHINKTVLLKTSGNSRVVSNPVEVSYRILQQDITQLPLKPYQITGVLLEGTFFSTFRYGTDESRLTGIRKIDSVANGKIMVISDGDFIKNEIDKNGIPLPAGYDPNSTQANEKKVPIIYGNKEFFINTVDYMLDSNNLIELRSKELVIRLLDKNRAQKEKEKWQVFNLVLPIAIILVFGVVNNYIRKRKYTKAA